MKRPIVEFYYKNDDLGDPMINADYAEAFGLATDAQVAEIKAYALKINEILKAFLAERKVRLIDFKGIWRRCRRKSDPRRRDHT